MDDKTTWTLYFAGVCAFRFHPRNTDMSWQDALKQIDYAANITDQMMIERNKRWDGDNSGEP